MADFFGIAEKEDVVDAVSYANYVQQRLGTPYPSQKNLQILRRHIRAFFEQNPQADYRTLCELVDWAKNRKKRYAHVHTLVTAARYAWADGYLKALNPSEPQVKELEEGITAALSQETDPQWRARLTASAGAKRKEVYEAWLQARAQRSSLSPA